jgi:hypothetical protein
MVENKLTREYSQIISIDGKQMTTNTVIPVLIDAILLSS